MLHTYVLHWSGRWNSRFKILQCTCNLQQIDTNHVKFDSLDNRTRKSHFHVQITDKLTLVILHVHVYMYACKIPNLYEWHKMAGREWTSRMFVLCSSSSLKGCLILCELILQKTWSHYQPSPESINNRNSIKLKPLPELRVLQCVVLQDKNTTWVIIPRKLCTTKYWIVWRTKYFPLSEDTFVASFTSRSDQ